MRTIVLPALLGLAFSTPLAAQNDWARPGSAIRRLSPSDFPQLPNAVRTDLTQRGCTVPQAWLNPEPHNVVQGAFIRPDSKDWAVLCSRAGISRILVFRDGKTTRVDSLARMPDRSYSHMSDSGGIIYHRKIGAVRIRAACEYPST